MLFNSFDYAFFFIVTAAGFFLLPARLRNTWLLGCSLFFYMSWIPIFILLVLYSTTIDYFVAQRIEAAQEKRKKRRWLAVSLVTNFGALFFFKYYNFFAANWDGAAAWAGLPIRAPMLNIILPIGISFYTFEAISYTLDVYFGRYHAERSYPRLLLFIMFFPKLIAGPIERAGHLIPQFDRPVRFDYQRTVSGLAQILWGLFKKLVIADRLAILADMGYANVQVQSGGTLLLATLAFTFQIYCDFSAYSDIALGSARILGIDLLRNFRRPYYASGFSDFWSRWHISLSTWFRDYLYIPLGGNRGGFWRTNLNVFTVFLVSGIWHGANWTFVLWGIAHGTFILAENLWMRFVAPRVPFGAPRALKVAGTFACASLAWVLFRAATVADAATVYRRIFTDLSMPAQWVQAPSFVLYGVLGVALLVGVESLTERGLYGRLWSPGLRPLRWAGYATCVLLILLIGVFDGGQFIYFQF